MVPLPRFAGEESRLQSSQHQAIDELVVAGLVEIAEPCRFFEAGFAVEGTGGGVGGERRGFGEDLGAALGLDELGGTLQQLEGEAGAAAVGKNGDPVEV